jgi:hypothetical protein
VRDISGRLFNNNPSLTHFEVAQFSPFSPASGEKVADRPDEGVFGNTMFEKKPPHPALSPNSFATNCNLLTTSQIRK